MSIRGGEAVTQITGKQLFDALAACNSRGGYIKQWDEWTSIDGDFELDKVAAALFVPSPSIREAMEWRDIETAPKDGSKFLAICAEAQTPKANISWWQDGWFTVSKPEKFVAPGPHRWWPTHWMPLDALPAPPSTPAGESD